MPHTAASADDVFVFPFRCGFFLVRTCSAQLPADAWHRPVLERPHAGGLFGQYCTVPKTGNGYISKASAVARRCGVRGNR